MSAPDDFCRYCARPLTDRASRLVKTVNAPGSTDYTAVCAGEIP